MIILGTNSIKDTGYDVANSCRFNDGSSDSLTQTHSSSGNRRTFTISAWVKRSTLSYDFSYIFTAGTYNSTQMAQFKFDSNDQLNISGYASNGSQEFRVLTNQKFRDVSSFYHLIASVDTTQGTASNRVKLYINGTLYSGGFVEASYPSEDYDSAFNSNIIHSFGIRNGTSTYYDGYMAEVVMVDGQALDPTSFGEFDEDSGIWKPINVSGLTFGTNGFYLDFEDSSALGNDVSGNDNDFTVNNLTAIDQSTDTCTNNFATLNPLIPSNGSTSNGNLDYATSNSSNNFGYRVSTIGVSSGKFYAECKYISGAWGYIGIRSFFTSTVSHQLGYYSDDYAILRADGKIYNNNSGSTYATSWSTGDIIGVALDCDNNKLYFSKNGQWSNGSGAWDSTTFNSSVGDITIGSASSSTNGAYFFACNNWDSSTNSSFSWNYGSPSFAISSGNTDGNGYGNFEYAVPSGYFALNTKNLAEYG